MTQRGEHFFGDLLKSHPEDRYISLEIRPAKPRPRDPEGISEISRAEVDAVIKEFIDDRNRR